MINPLIMHVIKEYFKQIQRGGTTLSKIKRLFRKLFKLPFYVLAIPAVLIMRLVRPWLLVRIGGLLSTRIGHFNACTELRLCELKAGINVASQLLIDGSYADLLQTNSRFTQIVKNQLEPMQ